jgi:periplasmic protein TonB
MRPAPGTKHEPMSQANLGQSPNSRFLAGHVGDDPTPKGRLGGAGAVSLVVHVGAFMLAIYLATLPVSSLSPKPLFDIPREIVWLQEPGPGGGGGGGGNQMPDPPRQAELPGKDKITVPVAKPEAPKPEPPKPKEEPVQEQKMVIPAMTTTSGVEEIPGVIAGLPTAPTASQGSGSGGGAGTGRGTGMGPGDGSGLGPGSGGGTGGGVYRIGNGVVSPRLIKEVKPNYTGEAMRAKIQGIVQMEAIVMPDGSVGQVSITRSLDPTFGLDEEAIRTVKQWRFAPGTRLGQPVPVLVEIEMTFTLR